MTAPVRPGRQPAAPPARPLEQPVLRLRDRSKEIVAGFSSGQKAVVVVAVLAVVIGGYLFMSWAGKPSYVPLFSNLSSSDAAAITQKLATNKIPYELAEGGQQVMVPEQRRLPAAPRHGRRRPALLGRPGLQPARQLAGVTTSQFQQQVEYQQAVSDELEQTIESINGVSSAHGKRRHPPGEPLLLQRGPTLRLGPGLARSRA